MSLLDDVTKKLKAEARGADTLEFTVILKGMRLGDEFYVRRTEDGIDVRTKDEDDAVHFPVSVGLGRVEHNTSAMKKLAMRSITVTRTK